MGQEGDRVTSRTADGDAAIAKTRAAAIRPALATTATASAPDPEWDSIAAVAKKTAPTSRGRSKSVEKERRKRRDAEILGTDEGELPTEEKVVLLVSCSLNDRTSVPGHVYRCLVKEHRARAEARRRREETSGSEAGDKLRDSDNKSEGKGESATVPTLPQCRDAHAVIHHVASTFIESRPGFGSSPFLAKKLTSAVERLVFGELYNDVFAEIMEETKDSDEALMKKIGAYEIGHLQRMSQGDSMARSRRRIRGEDVSVEALGALLRLPEARVPSDKLNYCVNFVESISAHFCGDSNAHETIPEKDDLPTARRSMGADSLLKMVCEHIIVAKVPHLNAELMFLEEFARDENSLKGKEGYALVTLQSSLQFLNLSNDIEHDVIRHSY